MDDYKATLESIGDAIILWADPESQFTGFTKVRTTWTILLCSNELLSVLYKGTQDFEMYANCESNRFNCHGTKIILFQSITVLKYLWCKNKIVNAMPRVFIFTKNWQLFLLLPPPSLSLSLFSFSLISRDGFWQISHLPLALHLYTFYLSWLVLKWWKYYLPLIRTQSSFFTMYHKLCFVRTWLLKHAC